MFPGCYTKVPGLAAWVTDWAMIPDVRYSTFCPPRRLMSVPIIPEYSSTLLYAKCCPSSAATYCPIYGLVRQSEPFDYLILAEEETGLLIGQSGRVVMVNYYFDHVHTREFRFLFNSSKEPSKNALPSVSLINNSNLNLYVLTYLVYRWSCPKMGEDHPERCARGGRQIK